MNDLGTHLQTTCLQLTKGELLLGATTFHRGLEQ
jgi:hypothetical protein